MMLRSAACFWQAPSPGKRSAWAPLLRKLRAPHVIEPGAKRDWKPLSAFSDPTKTFVRPSARKRASRRFPAKGSPLPKIRVLGSCRKSASRRRIFFFDRPALSELVTQRTPLMTEHCPENAAPFQPPDLPGVDAPSGCRWLAHARPTGCPWGVTWAQRPETTSTYLCSPRTDVPRTS